MWKSVETVSDMQAYCLSYENEKKKIQISFSFHTGLSKSEIEQNMRVCRWYSNYSSKNNLVKYVHTLHFRDLGHSISNDQTFRKFSVPTPLICIKNVMVQSLIIQCILLLLRLLLILPSYIICLFIMTFCVIITILKLQDFVLLGLDALRIFLFCYTTC